MEAQIFLPILIMIISGWFTIEMWRKGSVSSILYAMCFIFYGFVQFVHQVGFAEQIWFASPEIVDRTSVIIIISILCLYIGEKFFVKIIVSNHSAYRRARSIERGKSSREKSIMWGDLYLGYIMWLSLGLASIGVMMVILDYGSISTALSTPRMLLRLQRTIIGSIGDHFSSLILIAFSISLQKKNKLVIFYSICIALFLIFFTGARVAVLYLIAPLLYRIVTMGPVKLGKKVILFSAVGVFSVVVAIGFFHVLRWQEERNVDAFVEVAKDPRTYEFLLLSESSDLNMIVRMYKAVQIFPSQSDWLYLNTYKSMALFWLPSSWSGGLKVDTMYLFAYAISGDYNVFVDRLSNHPTLFGDIYINFGYYFWIGSFVWGIAVGIYGWYSRRGDPSSVCGILMSSTIMYFMLLSIRGSIYQPFVTVMMHLLFLTSCTLLFRLFRK